MQFHALLPLFQQIPQDPAWEGNFLFDRSNTYLGVSSSAADLLNPRPYSGDDEAGEARGAPPLSLSTAFEGVLGFESHVTPGQYAR